MGGGGCPAAARSRHPGAATAGTGGAPAGVSRRAQRGGILRVTGESRPAAKGSGAARIRATAAPRTAGGRTGRVYAAFAGAARATPGARSTGGSCRPAARYSTPHTAAGDATGSSSTACRAGRSAAIATRGVHATVAGAAGGHTCGSRGACGCRSARGSCCASAAIATWRVHATVAGAAGGHTCSSRSACGSCRASAAIGTRRVHATDAGAGGRAGSRSARGSATIGTRGIHAPDAGAVRAATPARRGWEFATLLRGAG